MDAFEDPNSFYPATITDYDVTSTLHPQAPTYNALDNSLSIDLDSFAGNDVPPLLHRKHTAHAINFEDAFSDAVSNYEQQFGTDQPLQEAKTPPLDTEDPLLKFLSPTFHYPLLDYTYRTAPISIEAQLNGMFFSSMAEAPTSAPDDMTPVTRSVTCYRRNLFSVVGSISLPRSLRYISTERGDQIPIVATEVSLTATESMEGAAVKLISVPFKSASMPPGVEDKADKDPPTIPIDLLSGATEMDSSFVTLPLVWKRLQFRSSTANNGRRKELQQNYMCRVNLVATLSTGQRVTLCDLQSEPIVVRGRSPRAFAAKKEAPTSGGMYSMGRKPGSVSRQTTTDSISRVGPVKAETEYNLELAELGLTSDGWNMRHNGKMQQGAMTALPPDTFRINPNEFFAQSSPDMTRFPPQVNVPPAVNLSLTEDDVKVSSVSPRENASRKMPRLSATGRPPSFSLSTLQSNGNEEEDDAAHLYEYFPLGLDDWQEPVDAVYRPHVVHHIAIPSASKDMSKTRSKRYFSDASPL